MKLFSFDFSPKKFFCIIIPIVLIFVSCADTTSSSSDTVTKSQHWAEEVAKDIISKIRKEHPRIYLTPERIVELRNQALSSKSYWLGFLKDRMRESQAALLYALGEDKRLGLSRPHQEYGRIAAEALMKAIRENNSGTSPDGLAIIYDWVHGVLTEDEKRAFVNFCKMRLGEKLQIHDDKHHGYRCSPGPRGIIAALAFYGDGIDDAYARELLIQGIRDTLLDNLAMEHVAGKDGGFADGTGYFVQLGGTFYTFIALGIATDTDFFFEHEAIAKLPNHLIYAMLPFPVRRADNPENPNPGRYLAPFHDQAIAATSEHGSSGGNFAYMLAITAAEYRRHGDERKAGLYTWFLNEAFGGMPYIAEDTTAFVLMDWSIKPKSPREVGLPLAEALGWDEEKGQIDRDRFGKKAGIGWVSLRSKWDDPDATFAIFRVDPFYYHGHMHHDSLAFMIAKGEELVLARSGNYMGWYEGGSLKSNDPGWPQMSNFFWRTISSNNLLVYNPAENFGEWANDGGQRLPDGWDPKWGRTYNGTADGNDRDIGGLVRFERTKDYVYAAADATRAYNSTLVTSGDNPKVRLVQREFVFIGSPQGDQDYFVIFDRVDSVNPEFKKFWLLQLRAKPEFDGSHKVAVGGEDGGIHLSENTSSFHVRQDKAELFGKMLLPKNGNRIARRLGGWVTTYLKQSLKANDDGPLDIEVQSTEGLPEHPVVIITAKEPNPNIEVFDRFSVWPQGWIEAINTPLGQRVCYFCEGKTPQGKKPAKFLDVSEQGNQHRFCYATWSEGYSRIQAYGHRRSG